MPAQRHERTPFDDRAAYAPMACGLSWILLSVTSLAGAGLVACTASGATDVHGSTITRSTIEQTASKQITDRLGGGVYKVTCPHDLAARKGASMDCVTTFPDGEKFSGTAAVTAVSQGKAHWTYSPTSKPAK